MTCIMRSCFILFFVSMVFLQGTTLGRYFIIKKVLCVFFFISLNLQNVFVQGVLSVRIWQQMFVDLRFRHQANGVCWKIHQVRMGKWSTNARHLRWLLQTWGNTLRQRNVSMLVASIETLLESLLMLCLIHNLPQNFVPLIVTIIVPT